MSELEEEIDDVAEQIEEEREDTADWWEIDQELQRQLRKEKGLDY